MKKYPILQLSEITSKKEGINLVLSGGGVKGVAHLALLEYLEEMGIPINAISGSSAGALVGALYCSGLSTKEILAFFKTTPIFRYTWLNPRKAGIFDSEKYAVILDDKIKYKFEDLHIPLTICATNIEQNQPVYFNKGDIVKPLLASCAIPAVFSPVAINGELYSDGGIMDNFPVYPFLEQSPPIVGSYVCPPSLKPQIELNSILKVSSHSNSLLLFSANAHKFTTTTVVFPLGNYTSFDTKNIDKIYEEAKEYINKKAS